MTVERILIRRDTAANWTTANPVLALGEPGYDETGQRFKVGDGVTAWATLPYVTNNVGAVSSVNGHSGTVVLAASDVGAVATTGLDAATAAVVTPGGSATAAALAVDPTIRAAFVPKWKPSTAYASGEPVLNPSGQIVTANSAFTSGTTYSGTNWTVVSGGGASLPTQTGQSGKFLTTDGTAASWGSVPAGYTDEQAQDATAALIAAGTHSGITFAYNDAGNALSATVINGITQTAQSGTTYTFALGDAGTLVEFTNSSAVTATIPPNSSVNFPVGTTLSLRQYGAGQVTVAQGLGVTLHSRGNAVHTAGQYAEASLTQRAVDEWILSGDVA